MSFCVSYLKQKYNIIAKFEPQEENSDSSKSVDPLSLKMLFCLLQYAYKCISFYFFFQTG